MSKIDITMTATIRPGIVSQTLESYCSKIFKERDRYRLIINVDPVGEQVKAKEVLKVCNEISSNNGRMIKVYMRYKNYEFMSHWQTLRDYDYVPTLKKYLEYEKIAEEKYNCEVINMKNRRITLQKDGIIIHHLRKQSLQKESTST